MIVLSSDSPQIPGMICIVVGTIGGAFQANGLRMAHLSRTWAAVPGHIRSAGIAAASTIHDVAVPRISYTYEVSGHTHVGSRVRFGFPPNDMAAWEDIDTLNQFRDVTVYYDPHDREQSVLERGTTSQQWLCMAFLLGLLGLGIWLVTL
jgi:hypothetical protein